MILGEQINNQVEVINVEAIDVDAIDTVDPGGQIDDQHREDFHLCMKRLSPLLIREELTPPPRGIPCIARVGH